MISFEFRLPCHKTDAEPLQGCTACRGSLRPFGADDTRFLGSAGGRGVHLAVGGWAFCCGVVIQSVQAVLQAQPQAERSAQVYAPHWPQGLPRLGCSSDLLTHPLQAHQVQVEVHNLQRGPQSAVHAEAPLHGCVLVRSCILLGIHGRTMPGTYCLKFVTCNTWLFASRTAILLLERAVTEMTEPQNSSDAIIDRGS